MGYMTAYGFPRAGGHSNPAESCCEATVERGTGESLVSAMRRALDGLRKTQNWVIVEPFTVRYVETN